MPPTLVNDTLGRAMHDLRISVTDRCNFRCPYCMPEEAFGERYQFVAKTELLDFEEIERLTRVFVSLGVAKIRITGGEPLLRSRIERLIARLGAIEGLEDLALTTNGFLLAEGAAKLASAGLQRVTVSLDSLDDAVYRQMNGRNFGVARVLEGIEAASAAGMGPVKLNCVAVRGLNDSGIVDLARRFKGTDTIIRFIEFMDVGNRNSWTAADVMTGAEIFELIDAAWPLEAVEPNYAGEVASRFRYRDGSGEIGIIAPVSWPFCGGCTRARLSTDGRLVTCLFASAGLDLRTPLRRGAGDDELAEIITGAWATRDDRYSEQRAAVEAGGRPSEDSKLEMHHLGG